MIMARKLPRRLHAALQVALLTTCMVPVGVVAWLVFLTAISAGTPPPTPECKRIHDGEILVSSTLHTDGSLTCQYIDTTTLYGRAAKVRPGK